MNRKQRRAVKKQVGAEASEKMANQVAQFGTQYGINIGQASEVYIS